MRSTSQPSFEEHVVAFVDLDHAESRSPVAQDYALQSRDSLPEPSHEYPPSIKSPPPFQHSILAPASIPASAPGPNRVVTHSAPFNAPAFERSHVQIATLNIPSIGTFHQYPSLNPVTDTRQTASRAATIHTAATFGEVNVWVAYADEARRFDQDIVEGWQRSTDVLLIFAALFSAIVTAFLIESYKLLKVDNADVMIAILAQMAQRLDVNSPLIQHEAISSPYPFVPTRTASWVNVLWFTALGLSLMSAVISMLVKHWLYGYTVGMAAPTSMSASGKILKAQARLRHFRYQGLVHWHVPAIVAGLPLILHASGIIFGMGLILLLWELDHGCAITAIVICGTATLAYLVTTYLPLFRTDCPYKTPLSHFLGNCARFIYLVYRVIRSGNKASIIRNKDGRIKFKGALQSWEENYVKENDQKLGIKCMKWLMDNTRDQAIAVAADSELRAIDPGYAQDVTAPTP